MAAIALVAAAASIPVSGQTAAAAVVNGVTLQQWEVERELASLISAGSYHRNIPAERRAQLEREALDRLILKELESQWLRDRGLPFDAAAASEAWREVRDRFDSEESYQAALRSKGIDDGGFRRAFVRDAQAAAAEGEVLGSIQPPSSLEIEVYFLLHRDEYLRPEARHVVHALVYVPASASREQWERAEQRAAALAAEVRAGSVSMTEAATAVADQVPPTLRGEIGDLGFVHRGALQPALDEIVFATAPGMVSDPVQSIYGYHVIQVLQVLPPQPLELDEVRDAVADRMLRETRSQALADFAADLRRRAAIETMAWPETP